MSSTANLLDVSNLKVIWADAAGEWFLHVSGSVSPPQGNWSMGCMERFLIEYVKVYVLQSGKSVLLASSTHSLRMTPVNGIFLFSTYVKIRDRDLAQQLNAAHGIEIPDASAGVSIVLYDNSANPKGTLIPRPTNAGGNFFSTQENDSDHQTHSPFESGCSIVQPPQTCTDVVKGYVVTYTYRDNNSVLQSGSCTNSKIFKCANNYFEFLDGPANLLGSPHVTNYQNYNPDYHSCDDITWQ